MATRLDVLDKSLQETNRWLNDIEQQLDRGDRAQAYRALRATLHLVRDHVGPDNAAHLGAQLPLLLKGVLFEGWRPAPRQAPVRNRAAFLRKANELADGGLMPDPEAAVRAALRVICEHLNPATASRLARLFPEDLRDLWPESAEEATP